MCCEPPARRFGRGQAVLPLCDAAEADACCRNTALPEQKKFATKTLIML